jgi:hypothetical protein
LSIGVVGKPRARQSGSNHLLGAIAQFEKTTTVAKLKAARDRKIAAGEKCGGRKSYAEARPEMVEQATPS